MIGAEMMITVQREKSFSTATKIPSRTAIPSAIFSRRAYEPPAGAARTLLLRCAAVSLTRATYHAGGPTQTRPRDLESRPAQPTARSASSKSP